MAVKSDWWFPAWKATVSEALRLGREGTPGHAKPGAFDAAFGATELLCEGRDPIDAVIDRWDGLRMCGDRPSFSKPFSVRQDLVDGGVGPVVAEVFGRFHDDAERAGGCLFVRAADWSALVATEDDRIAVLVRSGSHEGLWLATFTHEVRRVPRVPVMPGGMNSCGILASGSNTPIALLYEHRRWPRWIRLDAGGPCCLINLREVWAFRETAALLGGILRGKRRAQDFFRQGMPLFIGDVAGALPNPGDRRAVLCLALMMRTMVWKSESSGG